VRTNDLFEAEFDRATKLTIELEEMRAQLRHEKEVRKVRKEALRKAIIKTRLTATLLTERKYGRTKRRIKSRF